MQVSAICSIKSCWNTAWQTQLKLLSMLCSITYIPFVLNYLTHMLSGGSAFVKSFLFSGLRLYSHEGTIRVSFLPFVCLWNQHPIFWQRSKYFSLLCNPKGFLIYIFCIQFSLKLMKCLFNVHILTPHDLSATLLFAAFTELWFLFSGQYSFFTEQYFGFRTFLSFCSSFIMGSAYLLRLPCSTSESHCRVLGLLISFVLIVLCSDPGFLSPCT